MPFVADNKARRTFDDERGLELVCRYGRETVDFAIRGPGLALDFPAVLRSKPLAGADSALPPAERKILVWLVLNLANRDEQTRGMVAQALDAFKGVHGFPAGQRVEVEFVESWDDAFAQAD
ncbi:MAG TPA: hypothetical protein VI168_00295 [Croceibacterium sp.]